MDHQQQITLDRETVDGLKLHDKKDRIVFDADLKGFGFRLREDGGRLRRSWIVQYRVKGRTRRFKIADYPTVNADKARDKATKVLAAVVLGGDPQTEREAERLNGSRTLIATANAYLEMKALQVERGQYRASSYRVCKLYLTGADYFGPLHKMPVTEITLADIATRLNTINRTSGSVTVGRARSALSSMFTWAMQQGFMGPNPRNPVIGTAAPDSAPSRDRVLKDTELAGIWRACRDDDFGKIVKLLMLTACRRDEIGGLRWSEIDRDNGTLTLPKERVKNKHEHTLPATPMALEIVLSVPERAGRDHLFGDRSQSGFTAWGEAKAELDARLAGKVAPWRLHDIRRSVATGMADLDVEPHIIEAVLNHYSGHRSGTAGIYNRAKYARQIHSALNLWDDHLRSLVEGGARKIVRFQQSAQTA
jgi:integrase